MRALLIQNVRVIDPANNRDETACVLSVDGKVSEVSPAIECPGAETIDGRGMVLCPGFIDLHTHLREPGREDKETIASGTRAAAAGGFTTVCPIPNTFPVIDSQTGLKFVLSCADTDACVRVAPYASVTKGQAGEEIVEFGDLVDCGAKGFTDDGHPIMNAEIVRRALEYSAMFDVPILDHCEDLNLSDGGVMHEGFYATKLGMKGIPALAESTQVSRDVELAAFTGGHVHICHVSKRESLEHIRRGKARGVRVTCEVTPHHLTLTDAVMENFSTVFKVNPALGSDKDRDALVEALADGTIDCVATDHAPHTDIEKDQPLIDAPPGMIGLETAFPVLYTRLVLTGRLKLGVLIQRMTAGPARVLRLEPRGTLSPGAPADMVLVDLDRERTVDHDYFQSKSRNSPFLGEKLKGSIETTIVGGKVVYRDRQFV